MPNETKPSTFDHVAMRAEFEALMARSEIVVVPEWSAGVLANYIEMRRLAHILRQQRSVEAEPSAVFSLTNVMRGLDK